MVQKLLELLAKFFEGKNTDFPRIRTWETKKGKDGIGQTEEEETRGKKRILEMFQDHYTSICHLFVTR